MDGKGKEARLVEMLTDAVKTGDIETAQRMVVSLANMNLKLDINVIQEKNDHELEPPFKITVQVEDRESAGASFELLVRSTDKIEDLKKRVWQSFKFPVEVQKWIIGKRISDDKATLAKFGIRSPTVVFLYLLTAHSVGLRPSQADNGRSEIDNSEAVGMDDSMLNFSYAQSLTVDPSRLPYEPMSSPLLPMNSARPGLEEGSRLGFYDHLPMNEGVEAEENDDEEEEDEDSTWNCPKCTYENNTSLSACEMCQASINGVPEYNEYPGLQIGDRVEWQTTSAYERGTARWIGTLPDMEGEKITVGVEADNPVGLGTGLYNKKRLFYAKEGHAVLVASNALKRL